MKCEKLHLFHCFAVRDDPNLFKACKSVAPHSLFITFNLLPSMSQVFTQKTRNY